MKRSARFIAALCAAALCGNPGYAQLNRPADKPLPRADRNSHLYPTLADFCGVTAPRKLAGQSLRPLLAAPRAPHKDAAFTLVTRGPQRFGRSVRTARWRFTQWSDGTSELYDHHADSEETRDLSKRTEHAATIAELKARLRSLPPWPMTK